MTPLTLAEAVEFAKLGEELERLFQRMMRKPKWPRRGDADLERWYQLALRYNKLSRGHVPPA